MKLPSAPGIAFGLSHLLGEKMRLAHMLSSPSSSSLEIPAPSAYLATRCPPSLAPQLDQDDVCSCGSPSSGLPLCPAAPDDFPNHYSTAICLEDLRDGKRSPTCGIEFHDRVSEDANPVGGIGGGSGASGTTGGDPDRVDTVETRKCPEGFLKILTGPENFICQDSASPHSCGDKHTDCTRTAGALMSECVFGECEIVMCMEGWRFKLAHDGGAECAPSKPSYFFSSNNDEDYDD